MDEPRCKRSLSVSVRAALAIIVATATIAFVVCLMLVSSERGSAQLRSLPLFGARKLLPGEPDLNICSAPDFSRTTLKLARKEPFAALFARTGGTGHRYEASDIIKYGEYFYVVFDNLFALGRVHMNLPFNSMDNWLIPQLVNGSLLYDPANDPNLMSADPTGASDKNKRLSLRRRIVDRLNHPFGVGVRPARHGPASGTASGLPASEFDPALNAIARLTVLPTMRRDADGDKIDEDEELPLMSLEAPAANKRTGDSGYEAIARDKIDGRWYVIQEALQTSDGKIHASVDDLKFNKDMESYTLERSCLTEFEFTHVSRGFEGAFAARRKGEFFLVALCEGNWCVGGKKGREAGNGRLVVMKQYADKHGCVWKTHRIVHLPPTVQFIDYSAVTTYHDTEDPENLRIVISSQETSKVWIGRLDLDKWEVYDYEKPRLYNFPRNDQCQVIFCNVEGVHVLEDGMLAVVSDKMKSKGRQPAHCLAQDQSLSIFVVPD